MTKISANKDILLQAMRGVFRPDELYSVPASPTRKVSGEPTVISALPVYAVDNESDILFDFPEELEFIEQSSPFTEQFLDSDFIDKLLDQYFNVSETSNEHALPFAYQQDIQLEDIRVRDILLTNLEKKMDANRYIFSQFF